jgi:hypothetical protein
MNGISNQDYTGSAIIFPDIIIYANGVRLVPKTDYSVTYRNNTNAGTASVIIETTPNSLYTGTYTKTFSIRKAQKIKNVSSTYKKSYGDSSFTIKPKVYDNAKIYYSSSNDKVASVSSKGVVTIKKVGVAYITVSTKKTSAYYAATKTVAVTVAPKKESITYLKSTKSARLTVKWAKDTKATGYQMQYSRYSNFPGGKTTTVTVSKNSTVAQTMKNLAKGKNYYVRVRSYKKATVNGATTNLYGKWSSTGKVTVKK